MFAALACEKNRLAGVYAGVSGQSVTANTPNSLQENFTHFFSSSWSLSRIDRIYTNLSPWILRELMHNGGTLDDAEALMALSHDTCDFARCASAHCASP